jgi:hypothetical protein
MRAALASAVVLAALVGPVALANDGDPMRVGAGNSAQTAETRIIAQNVSTFATRQSNNKEGDGGAATYGCRSSLGNEPCLAVFSLRTARAFDFRSRGPEGGVITVQGDPNPRNNRPFTTNATGVATGLNADEVDGRNADELRAKYALVNGDGTLANGNGVAGVSRIDEGTYTVGFDRDVDGCAYTATIGSANISGTAGVERATDTSLLVRTRSLPDGNPADRPVNVVVNC